MINTGGDAPVGGPADASVRGRTRAMRIASRSPVVVGVGGVALENSRAALHYAAEEARRHECDIVLVRGVPMHVRSHGEESLTEERHESERLLQEAIRLLGRITDVDTKIRWVNSRQSVLAILHEASQSASVLVLQRRRHRLLAGTGLGSVTEAVAAHASCPVVVVRPERLDRSRLPVVVGVALDGRSSTALSTAADEASWRAVDLVAVHGWQAPDDSSLTADLLRSLEMRARQDLATAIAGLVWRYPDVRIDQRCIQGATADVLRETSDGGQLLVVARHSDGADSSRHALGATAQDLIRHCRSPLCVTGVDAVDVDETASRSSAGPTPGQDLDGERDGSTSGARRS